MRGTMSLSMDISTGEIVKKNAEEDGLKQCKYIERLILKDEEKRRKQGKKKK